MAAYFQCLHMIPYRNSVYKDVKNVSQIGVGKIALYYIINLLKEFSAWKFGLFLKVLPRQVCALYTKNLKYADYPGGPAKLEGNIFGGELFDTILYNYVSTCKM